MRVRLNAWNIYETQMSEGIAIIIGMIIACVVRVVGSMNSERAAQSSVCLHLRQILTVLYNL